MPTSKQTPAVTNANPPTPKKKKKPEAPPPPPPHEAHSAKSSGKPGKKHPKKGPKEHDSKSAGKHLRRAFEHLGRVEALHSLAHSESLSTLIHLAQASIDHEGARSAADLLRAAEHLSFAALAGTSQAGTEKPKTEETDTPALSPVLEQAIRREFRKLLEHADEHELPRASTLGTLLRETLDQARTAFDSQNFRQALELARAAEALSSIDREDAARLEPSASKRALKA